MTSESAGAAPAEIPTGPVESAAQRVAELLQPLIPDANAGAHHTYVEVYVPPDRLVDAARELRDGLGYA